MDHKLLIALLQAEVVPTMGCTEPGAVALAAAYASEVLEGRFDRIDVIVNSNVYKNAMAVGIPGTDAIGLDIAVALGAIKRHSERQLAVLSEVIPEELAEAKAVLLDGRVTVSIDDSKDQLWIEVLIKAGNEWSRVVIQDQHTRVVSIQKNGDSLYERKQDDAQQTADQRLVLRGSAVKISEIVKAVEALAYSDLEMLLEGAKMNHAAAKIGMDKKLGMGIGSMLADMVDTGVLSNDLINNAKMLTAAAVDARMSGENISVMSSAGSGNHGITVILPVYAVAQKNRDSSGVVGKGFGPQPLDYYLYKNAYRSFVSFMWLRCSRCYRG